MTDHASWTTSDTDHNALQAFFNHLSSTNSNLIDNSNVYLNGDLGKEADGLPLSLDDILQGAAEDEENGSGPILQSQSNNQFEYYDDDEDDDDEERKAAVQAAMMGIPTSYNRPEGHHEQGRLLSIGIDEEEEKDDRLRSDDWRQNPVIDERLVKVESEDEEDYKLLDSHSPTANTRPYIVQDRLGRQSTNEQMVRTENQARIRLQASHLLEGDPDSSELFMRDKPGVAGLPIRGPNSAESPVYVNPKQYDRIMKRRIARARLEEMGRLSRERKPYLHESRHKHAVRRPRGPRGRFLTKEELAERGDPSSVADSSL